MSFVFSSLGCRLTAVAVLALSTAGCSGSDRIPLADIGGPQKGDVLIGRVEKRDGRVLVGRVGAVSSEAVAYAPPATAANGGSAGIDYLNTPNLAAVAPAQSEISAAPQSQTAMAIPEGGVNIDGELGVDQASSDVASADLSSGDAVADGYRETEGVQPQIVTQGGAMAMAEGQTSQPVVDGIGFDEPTEIVTGPSGAAAGTVQVADAVPEESGILPLSVDSGTSGMNDPAPVSSRRVAAAQAPARSPAGKDCSLYLDKRNCR
ncbi:hypothetical protein ASE36_19435 [Rhizobium sp. Root274]|uniref:hypothetical protein n=1 Tax=unclassified Rhizobium TaxID=2613769 RepID=UPI0007132759|nr:MULTISPECIES: hypothetical protein [unclassified Rhizobium]KQW26957.1 hypothetical protein ASC71_19640 [Rhizobium sp. Root1240]KRD27981.1 hypothetical protein ASE36_19435 [Rhizobium sp. Root274]